MTEDELTVGAGKAYLQIPSSLTMTTRAVDAAEPDAFNLKFDEDPESVISLKVYSLGGSDGTTGIGEVINEEVMSDQWYNLNGQRIDRPQKPDLYIMNGRKVIVK